nr:MAG TPA: hypothetical protein [Caudoviricetes sp.]
MTDASLADPIPVDDDTPATVPDASLADPTAPLPMEQEKFDLAAWIAGVRPARRATTVYARPDLLADLDLLAERYALTSPASPDRPALEQQMRDLREQVEASGLDIIVEARSEELRQTMAQALEKDGLKATDIDYQLAMIASQIIQPANLDAATLKTLYKISPVQVAKIAQAATAANTEAPKVELPF